VVCSPSFSRTIVSMDTFVTIEVVEPVAECAELVERAFGWFDEIVRRCSRFEPESEVMRLSTRVGSPVTVSPLLFEAVSFALAVARASGGAFDPTIGGALEARGFNRSYQTGATIDSSQRVAEAVSYDDVELDPAQSTITLRRPLVLDLGAVVKGMAIDLAVRELRSFENFSINAGGDIYAAGHGPEGDRWNIGLRHPRQPDDIFDILRVSNVAVCTSGDYERPGGNGASGHHIVNAKTCRSPTRIASLTVVAPTAMAADALGTAAFVLGPTRGLRFLESQGVDGLIVSPSLKQAETSGFSRYRQ
jgi:thiamine biosynthesis lipoprotein